MKATFIAGPCVIESAELLDIVAAKLVEINKKLGTDIIFKASFDKANRTSMSSFRGPGIDHGLLMLSDVKSKYGLRVLTDIHASSTSRRPSSFLVTTCVIRWRKPAKQGPAMYG